MEVCCTICGCNDVEVLSEPSVIAPLPTAAVQGAPWPVPGRGKCNHCRETFGFTSDEPVERTRPLRYEIHCPECNSPHTDVYCTKAPKGGYQKRYLKCLDCGATFKTNDPLSGPDIHTR